MNFSDRFKQLRKEKQLTQEQLCQAIKDQSNYVLSQARVNHWEVGKHTPDTDVCIIIADFFGVSVDYLIGHSDIRTALTEFEEYKLNPTEKSIVDIVRSYPDDYGDSVLQLLQVGVKYKK